MKVWPRNDDIRKFLKHPSAGPFRAKGIDTEWPDDTFTHRRLVDGDILLEDPDKPAASFSPKANKGDK